MNPITPEQNSWKLWRRKVRSSDWSLHGIRRMEITLYIRESASVIRDADGKILYYDGMLRILLTGSQAEQALRESEDKLIRI